MFKIKRQYFFVFLFIRSKREFLSLLPTLRGLRQYFPKSCIEIVTNCSDLSVCDVESLVNRFIYCKDSLLSFLILSRSIPLYDVGFVVSPVSSKKLNCLLSRIRYRIGFSNFRCVHLLTHEVQKKTPMYMGESYFSLLEELLPFDEEQKEQLFFKRWEVSHSLSSQERNFLEKYNLLENSFIVIEAPEDFNSYKMWSIERLIRLVKYISINLGYSVVLVGGSRSFKKQLPLLSTSQLLFAPKDWNILLAVLEYSSLVIAFDSEVAQIAGLKQKKTGVLLSLETSEKLYFYKEFVEPICSPDSKTSSISLSQLVNFVENRVYNLNDKERIVLC